MITNPWKWFEDQEPRAKKIYGAVAAVLALILTCFTLFHHLGPSAELRSAKQHLKRVKLELDSRNPPMICLDIERLRSHCEKAFTEAWTATRLELRIKLGNIEYTHGTYENALKQFSLALELAEDKGKKDLELICLNNLGIVNLRQGSVGSALNYFRRAERQSGDDEDFRKQRAAAIGNMGLAHNSNRDTYEAMKHFEKALVMYKTAATRESQVGLANSWRNLAMIHRSFNNMDAAIKTLEEAFHLFKSLDTKVGQGQVLADIGQIYLQKEDYHRARKYFEEAVRKHEKDPAYTLGAANAKNLIGNTYAREGKYADALIHFNDAKTDFQRINYNEGTASTLRRIAHVFREKKLPETAIEYLKEAERISRSIQGKRREGETLVLMSEISVENDVGSREYQQEKLKRALKIAREIPVTEWEAKCLYLIGEIHRKNKQPKNKELRNKELKKAEKFYSEALEIFTRLNEGSFKDTSLRNEIAKQHRGLREIYVEKREIDRALEHAQKALQFARETEDKKDDADDFFAIGKIYAKRESPEAARPYFKLALDIRARLSDTLGQADAWQRMADTHKKGDHCTPKAAEHLQYALNTLEEPADNKDAATARQIKERKADILVRLAAFQKESDDESEQRKCLKRWEKACDIYEELGSSKLNVNRARYLILQGKKLVREEKEEQAIAKFREATKLAGQVSKEDQDVSAEIRSRALVEIADALRNKGLLDESKKTLYQASGICMSIRPDDRCEKLSFRIGKSLIRLVNYNSSLNQVRISLLEEPDLLLRAEKHLEDALRLIHGLEMNDPTRVLYSRILQHIGLAHQKRGSVSKALQNFHAALRIAKQVRRKKLLADQYMDLGRLKLKCNDEQRSPCALRPRRGTSDGNFKAVLQEAVHYFDRAKEIYHERGDHLSEAKALRQLALARANGDEEDRKKARSLRKKADYIAYSQVDTRRKWELIRRMMKDPSPPEKQALDKKHERPRAECQDKDVPQRAYETPYVFQAAQSGR